MMVIETIYINEIKQLISIIYRKMSNRISNLIFAEREDKAIEANMENIETNIDFGRV